MTMNTLQIEVWSKVHRKKKWKVTRPNLKLEVGARMICRRFMKGGKVEEYGCQIVA